jgi:excisionase family DNA binding protein
VDKLLVRPAEAAEVLGVGRSTIYALIANDQIPAVRVGRSLRVPMAALRAWADGQVHQTIVETRVQPAQAGPEIGKG